MLSRVLSAVLPVVTLVAGFLAIPSFACGSYGYVSNGCGSYSYVSTGIGYNRLLRNEGNIKQGNTKFIEGGHQLGESPFIARAGYAYDESLYGAQYGHAEMASYTYFVGGQLLLKPFDRLHLLPSLSYGQFRHMIHSDAGYSSFRHHVYNLGLDASYHIQKNLWWKLGYTRPIDQYKCINRSGFATIGLEYKAPKQPCGFGVQYRRHHLQQSTQFFLKFFL